MSLLSTASAPLVQRPTYNYSYIANEGGTAPLIAIAKHCRLLAVNHTILS
jgi:hypothetical protein